VLLCPQWSDHWSTFRALARAETRLPAGPLFRREGWDTMPEPPWTCWVFWIQRIKPSTNSLLGRSFPRDITPSVRRITTRRRIDLAELSKWGTFGDGSYRPLRASLLQCGDVEPNPGPRSAPSSGGSGLEILNSLRQKGLDSDFQLFFTDRAPAQRRGRVHRTHPRGPGGRPDAGAEECSACRMCGHWYSMPQCALCFARGEAKNYSAAVMSRATLGHDTGGPPAQLSTLWTGNSNTRGCWI
jgi:hypothetical protein